MERKLQMLIVFVMSVLCYSCSTIEVCKGPFAIEFDEHLIESKQQYLNSLSLKESKENKPNILLILVDDLGRDDISIYNREGVNTPHLSQLANSGVTFTNAYSTSSVCSPSRASLLTGRLKKYRAIEADCIANAMISLAKSEHKTQILNSDMIQKLGS